MAQPTATNAAALLAPISAAPIEMAAESSVDETSPTDFLNTDLPSSSFPGAPAPMQHAPEYRVAQTASEPPIQSTTVPVVQATGPTELSTNQDVLQTAQWGNNPIPQTQRGNLAQGISAAGIPLYPNAGASVPSTNEPLPAQEVAQQLTPPAPSISPNSRMVSPIDAISMPAPNSTGSVANSNSNNMMVVKGSPISSATRTSPMTPLSPTYQPRQDYFTPQPVEAPVIATPSPTPSPAPSACSSCGGRGCPDCGIAAGNGGQYAGCPTCGAEGCFNPDHVAEQFANCGSVSQAKRYLVAEGLYLTRRDGIIANSNFGALSDFDWTGGLRVTLGRRFDCIAGREFTYFGTNDISQGNRHVDPVGRINARFTTADGFLPSEISAFRNAVEQIETKQTSLHSLEFNRVEWGWDVVKNYVGLRYIYNDDSYVMASRNLANETGLFEVYVKNNLIGPIFGSEMYYDVGYRLSGSFIVRGGFYASLSNVQTKLLNAGTQFLDVVDNNASVGGTVELGLNGRFKITKGASLRFGYNVMWLDYVAEASHNVPTVITPSIGAGTTNREQMQFHGASFGFEIFR